MRLLESFFVFLTLIFFGSCATYNFYPSNTTFATQLNTLALVGGDVVNFRAATNGGSATYDFKAFASTYRWNGQQNNPIIIRAFPGDKIILTTSNPDSNILQLGGSYWRFTGFEMVGHASAQGSIALRLMDNTNHVVIDSLKIHDLYQNAVTGNLPGADYNNITIRGCEVWNTAGAGECFYFGCQRSSSTTTPCQMHDSLIENNYCHDTCKGGGNTQCSGGSMGSGYQVKFGSYRNIIRNNVCFNVFSPCILLYDDWGKGSNLVEGNVVLNTAGDSGIQISAGGVIRNNVVIGSAGSGIYISDNPNNLYNGLGIRNLVIEHNTFVNNGEYGIKFQSRPTSTTVRNNAVLSNAGGDFFSSDQTGVTYSRNAYNTGSLPNGVASNTGAYLVSATSNQLTDVANFNVYPKTTSQLIGNGSTSGLAYDFNNRARNGCKPTVGAYEFSTSTNPGWAVTKGFKQLTGNVNSCSLNLAACAIACTPSTPAPATPAPATPAPATPAPATPAPATPAPATPAPATPAPATPAPATPAPASKIDTKNKIIAAINSATSGSIITIEPGTYVFTEGKVDILNKAPATLRALTKGTVKLRFGSAGNYIEGFVVSNSPGWTFENLEIEGTCGNLANCDYAFSIKSNSNNLVFRNNNLINFNRQIKTATTPGINGLIVGNTFFDRVPRTVGNYKVDINGNGWTVRGNHFYSFSSTNTGALVGAITANSYSGLTIDANLIVGTKTGTTLGLVLKNGSGTTLVSNNIITSTSDVGIYSERVNVLNVFNNFIYDTVGIDSRFPEAKAVVRNNVISGRIKDRDAPIATQSSNNVIDSVSVINTYFAGASSLNFKLTSAGVAITKDKGIAVSVPKDYCLNTRSGTNDIGIFDQSFTACSTNVPFNVANPSVRSLSISDSNKSTSTTDNKKSDDGVYVYIIVAVAAFIGVALIVAVVIVQVRKRKQVNDNLHEPLLDKNQTN